MPGRTSDPARLRHDRTRFGRDGLAAAAGVPIIGGKGESGMGYVQVMVAAATMAVTYGGVIGTDMLLERIGGASVEQSLPAAPEAGEQEERQAD